MKKQKELSAFMKKHILAHPYLYVQAAVNEAQGFERDTKAIRLRIRKGSIKQSQVFFPSPTMEDALNEAREAGMSYMKRGFSWEISEAKRVKV